MQAKIAISLPTEMLAIGGGMASARAISRSAVIRETVDYFIRMERQQQVMAEAREIYAAIESEDRALAEAYSALNSETWPIYEDGGSVS